MRKHWISVFEYLRFVKLRDSLFVCDLRETARCLVCSAANVQVACFLRLECDVSST
jgi:hypothetical protein